MPISLSFVSQQQGRSCKLPKTIYQQKMCHSQFLILFDDSMGGKVQYLIAVCLVALVASTMLSAGHSSLLPPAILTRQSPI